MNSYIKLISEMIDFIEANLHQKLQLEDIATQFNISKFHFNRMFKAVSGVTLKQYILGRKLTEALRYLERTDASIIDTAFEFGFEYPEIFSRAFKKHFGASPFEYKNKKMSLQLVEKANIVEREIINCKGTMTLNGSCIYLNTLTLQGVSIEVDVQDEQFKSVMNTSGENFLAAAGHSDWLQPKTLYVVVNCHEIDNGQYTVFYGMQGAVENQETSFKKRVIPEGWYTKFIYTGDMFAVREAFIDDLYRWVIVKEAELDANGIGMINLFEEDYFETNEVQILVPIKRPL